MIVPSSIPNVKCDVRHRSSEEVEALAAQGPGAIYAWVYDPNSLTAKKMAGVTWEDLGEKAPVPGCRNLIRGLRQAAELLTLQQQRSI